MPALICADNAVSAIRFACVVCVLLTDVLFEEERLLIPLFLRIMFTEHGFQRVGMEPGGKNRGGQGQWGRGEILYLIRVQSHRPCLLGKSCHILCFASWMRGNEIWYDLLSQPFVSIYSVKDALELVELCKRGFPHHIQHMIFCMFRCYLQTS